jgi:hypothetical protein
MRRTYKKEIQKVLDGLEIPLRVVGAKRTFGLLRWNTLPKSNNLKDFHFNKLKVEDLASMDEVLEEVKLNYMQTLPFMY